jgi:glycine oxidase
MRRRGSVPDVLIIGGGVIGCAVAYVLARAGIGVRLLEQHRVGAHASGGAAGLLAVHAERMDEGSFEQLALASRDLFRTYAPRLQEETGIDIEFQQHGLLMLIEPERAAAARAAEQRSQHLRWLEPIEVCELEPALGTRWGALFSPQDGQVNSGRLTQALAEAAARHGAQIDEGVVVTGLLVDGERVCGVQSSAGHIHAALVIIAAGPWSGLLGDAICCPIPVSPVKGQLVWARMRPLVLRRPVYAPGCYLAPKYTQGIVIGATEEDTGFDEHPTLGAVADLIAAAIEVCPTLRDAEFTRVWASLRPCSADGLPLIGPVPERQGLFLATGHFRNGILLSLITAELIANWVLEQPQPFDVSPFLPSRLRTTSAP